MDYYTIGRCIKCSKNVKIDFLERLLNLDKEILCKKCNKKVIKDKSVNYIKEEQ